MSYTEREILLFELEAVTTAIDRSNCGMKELVTLINKLGEIMDKLRIEVIKEIHDDGVSYTEIASYLGVSRQAVSGFMRRQGVRTRKARNA